MEKDEMLRELLSYRSELFGFIMAMVRNVSEAEDLFQNVSLAIVEKANEAADVRNFRPWAKEIARHQVWNYYRQQKARKTFCLPSEEMAQLMDEACMPSTPDPLVLKEEHDAILRCLAKLRDRARRIVELRFVDGCEYEEMARLLHLEENAIRQAALRARQALMKCVTSLLAEPVRN